MAIFASTTTSGYSDPLKALSIKALEQRQKDMMAQAAADKPDAAMMATIPGGIGHVLGVVGDKLAQGRADQALVDNRAELAKTMSGYNADQGLTGEQAASLSRVAPEILDKLLQHQQERWTTKTTEAGLGGRNAATIAGQKETNAATNATQVATNKLTNETSAANNAATIGGEGARLQTRVEADKAAATEKARVEREAAVDAEQRAANRPASDAAKIMQDVQAGKLTPQQGDDLIKKLTANSPSEEKLLIGERDKAVEYQSTMQQLDKAYELISSPKGIHSGSAIGTPLKTGIGSVLPQSLGGPDDETQANTMQFNQIMKSQGLQNLLAMKGASSDKDVTLNLEIANDPKQPLERRKQALGIARDKLYTHVQANREDIKRLSGTYPELQSAPGSKPAAAAAAAPDQNAAARAWLANPANKNNPDYEAVRQKVEGK